MDDALRQTAREVIAVEAAAVARMADAIDDAFERAVRLILNCPASVLTAGMGKAGHIARKVAATLASTGTPAHAISVADAVHGDAGSVRDGDVLLIFSSSGESEEIVSLLTLVKRFDHPVIAVTATASSRLGRHADVAILTGRIEEACPLRLAPSASTTAMLALGDALALSVMKLRNFTAEDFALYHPAGQLGRKLMRVGEAMTFKRGENLPLSPDTQTVGEVLQAAGRIKRRSGAVVLFDENSEKISGIFSDGDLRRLIVSAGDAALRTPVADVMTRDPKRVSADALTGEAMAVMKKYRVDELPVVDGQDRPIGLIDVQDLVVLKMLDTAADDDGGQSSGPEA